MDSGDELRGANDGRCFVHEGREAELSLSPLPKSCPEFPPAIFGRTKVAIKQMLHGERPVTDHVVVHQFVDLRQAGPTVMMEHDQIGIVGDGDSRFERTVQEVDILR